MSYTMDVPKFIQEVRKYPEIWHANTEKHKFDRTKRMAAWCNVARVFISDFDELEDQEKDEVYTKLHGKWRNIRDSYVRHRNNRYSKRGYVYANILTFLDVNFDQSTSEYDDTETRDSRDTGSDEEEKFLKKIQFVRAGTKEKPHLELELLGDDDSHLGEDHGGPSFEEFTIQREGKKKRKKYEEILETEHVLVEPDGSARADDDNKFFFDSLLPMVRDFDIDQKLEFRKEVLELIRRIRTLR